MDLAESIRENTKAVQALTAALNAHFSFGAPQIINMSGEDVVEHIVAAPPPAEQPALEYDRDVKPAALALAKADRAKLVAILESFGCKKATELKAEQYAEFVEACK